MLTGIIRCEGNRNWDTCGGLNNIAVWLGSKAVIVYRYRIDYDSICPVIGDCYHAGAGTASRNIPDGKQQRIDYYEFGCA